MGKQRELGFASIVFILAILLILVSGFALWRVYKQKAPVPSLVKEKITVANVGEYSIFNLIAQEKGFFDNNNLDAEIKEHSSGPPGVADLLEGKADFAIAADFVGVNNIFKNEDIRLLAQASEHDVFSIVARNDSGINVPGDINGKRIGVTKNGAGEFFLGRFLIFNDLKLSDITLIDLQQPDLIKQIEDGELDAIVIFEPHTFKFKKSDKFTVFSAQGQEKTRAVVYTMAATVKTRPDVVTRYIRALTQAESYFKTNPDESKAILARRMNYPMDYIEYLWPKINFGLFLPQELLLTMENEARFVISNAMAVKTEVPNYLDYIYFDALSNAKPEAVTIVH